MAKDKRLVIGIDFGTGSSKGVLARLNGKVIATSEKPHRTSMPKPGHVEHATVDLPGGGKAWASA